VTIGCLTGAGEEMGGDAGGVCWTGGDVVCVVVGEVEVWVVGDEFSSGIMLVGHGET